MNIKLDFDSLVRQAQAILATLIRLGLLIILAVVTLRYFHLSQPYVTPPNSTELAYICGAWWLWSKT